MRVMSSLFAAVLLAASVSAAHAAAWEFRPRLELGAEYNDNFRLGFEGQEIEISGLALDAALTSSMRTPTSLFTFTPRVRVPYYPDERDQESDTRSANLRYENHAQRRDFLFRAVYTSVDVTESELPSSFEDVELGEIPDGDAGLVALKNRRDRISLEPSISFDVSERRRLELGARFDDISFSREIPGFQKGYQNLRGSVGLAFDVTPLSSLTVSAETARYRPDDELGLADVYGARLEWNKRVSETQRYYLRGGADFVDSEVDFGAGRITDSTTVYNAGAGAQWKFQVTDFFVDAQHLVNPNSSGFLVERDEVRLTLVRHLRERFALNFGIRGFQDQQVGETAETDRKRRYATATAGFSWQTARNWWVTGQYEFIWQELTDQVDDAHANRLGVSVVYEPQRRE
jgi:hypothetical protein